MSEGFVERDTDLSSILSPEALAALQGLAVERGVMSAGSAGVSSKDLVGGLQKHFERNKIGEKDTTFHMKFGDIEFDVKGVKQNLGQTLDSTGLTIWRAAEHLCEWIMKNSNVFAGKHVCELGGGLGLVSILLHKLEVAASICCTDGDEISLKLLRENVEDTGCGGDKPLVVEKLYWGEHADFIESHPEVDTIIAADVIYEEEQIEPLLCTAVAILQNAKKDSAQLILAYARRNVPIDLVLVCAERLGLQHEYLDGEVEPIVRFQLKSATEAAEATKEGTVFR